jgi:hypothetical protein
MDLLEKKKETGGGDVAGKRVRRERSGEEGKKGIERRRDKILPPQNPGSATTVSLSLWV